MFPSCREVVTFNHFLEEAAEKEVRGKARLQHFIENLLQRVDLAERQLEYYQNQQMVCNHIDVSEHVVSQQSPSHHCHPPPKGKCWSLNTGGLTGTGSLLLQTHVDL